MGIVVSVQNNNCTNITTGNRRWGILSKYPSISLSIISFIKIELTGDSAYWS